MTEGCVKVEIEFHNDNSFHSTYKVPSYAKHAKHAEEAMSERLREQHIEHQIVLNPGPGKGYEQSAFGSCKNWFVSAREPGVKVRYPRLGAFEIALVFPPVLVQSRAIPHKLVVWSKLQTRRWPKTEQLQQLAGDVAALLSKLLLLTSKDEDVTELVQKLSVEGTSSRPSSARPPSSPRRHPPMLFGPGQRGGISTPVEVRKQNRPSSAAPFPTRALHTAPLTRSRPTSASRSKTDFQKSLPSEFWANITETYYARPPNPTKTKPPEPQCLDDADWLAPDVRAARAAPPLRKAVSHESAVTDAKEHDAGERESEAPDDDKEHLFANDATTDRHNEEQVQSDENITAGVVAEGSQVASHDDPDQQSEECCKNHSADTDTIPGQVSPQSEETQLAGRESNIRSYEEDEDGFEEDDDEFEKSVPETRKQSTTELETRESSQQLSKGSPSLEDPPNNTQHIATCGQDDKTLAPIAITTESLSEQREAEAGHGLDSSRDVQDETIAKDEQHATVKSQVQNPSHQSSKQEDDYEDDGFEDDGFEEDGFEEGEGQDESQTSAAPEAETTAKHEKESLSAHQQSEEGASTVDRNSHAEDKNDVSCGDGYEDSFEDEGSEDEDPSPAKDNANHPVMSGTDEFDYGEDGDPSFDHTDCSQ